MGLAVLLVAVPLVGFARVASAQSASVTGTFSIKYGDPLASGEGHKSIYSVFADNGDEYRLRLDTGVAEAAGGVTTLDKKRVTVRGPIQRAATPGGTSPAPVIDATSIEPQPAPSPPTAELAGPQKFATILCRFGDSTGVTPRTTTYINGLLGDTYPGISHFWKENSFNQINNTGSVVKGWFNLPRPRSYYVFNNTGAPGIHFDRLAADCTALADATVNYNDYVGINLLFNQNLDCCAWGGGEFLTLDGTGQVWPMTWMPPWGYSDQAVLGHEMGHAYGLPHSSGNYGEVYDSGWDVMSWGGRALGTAHPTYGRLGTHTIAHHKETLGWIPPARRYTAAPDSCQVITVDHLSQVTATAGTYLMAKIPTTANRWYTVEARKSNGYDSGGRLPGEAILIHDVLTTRDEPAHVVDATVNDDPNDAGAKWLPGETFNDAANGVKIDVIAATANGWSVRVTKGAGVCGGGLVNDNFASASTLAGNSGSASGTTSGATKEAGEPNHADNAGGASIWYSYTPTSSGTLSFDTSTSSFDTLLAVYRGTAVGSLTVVASDDDSGGTYQSQVGPFNVTGGVRYRIAIDGYGGATGATALNWTFSAAPPGITVGDARLTEGDSGSRTAYFTVSLSHPATSPVTVNYATANGTAVAPGDYTAKSGSLTFDPGVVSKAVTVTVKGETTDEGTETFRVNLSSLTNAVLEDGAGEATILDDDPGAAGVRLTVGDATVGEGDSGSRFAYVTVSLSKAAAAPVTVSYATANATAGAPSDYTTKTGSITFAAGTTNAGIALSVRADRLTEASETFNVVLSSPAGATITDGTGVVTIRNDD